MEHRRVGRPRLNPEAHGNPHLGPKPNKERRALVASMYRAGMSVRQIAAECGVTFQAVHGMLHRIGMTMRKPGGNQGSHSRHRK